jgi:hypothetical protein
MATSMATVSLARVISSLLLAEEEEDKKETARFLLKYSAPAINTIRVMTAPTTTPTKKTAEVAVSAMAALLAAATAEAPGYTLRCLVPQSSQSVPKAQVEELDLGPLSSHQPSFANLHVSAQK